MRPPLRNYVDPQSRIIAAHDKLDLQLVFCIVILLRLPFIGDCRTNPIKARHAGLRQSVDSGFPNCTGALCTVSPHDKKATPQGRLRTERLIYVEDTEQEFSIEHKRNVRPTRPPYGRSSCFPGKPDSTWEDGQDIFCFQQALLAFESEVPNECHHDVPSCSSLVGSLFCRHYHVYCNSLLMPSDLI